MGTPPPGPVKTVLLISCEDAPKWQGFSMPLWQQAVQCPGATWHDFHAPACQLPTLDQVRSAQVMVITGSHYSAYEDLPWIHALTEALPEYVATGIRIVACCFGHQVLSKALGGVIGKNPTGRFVLGVEDIVCDRQALDRLGLLAALGHQGTAAAPGAWGAGRAPGAGGAGATQQQDTFLPASHSSDGQVVMGLEAEGGCVLHQVESHGDCVLELPQGAVRLASSSSAMNEMWALGSNVLSFQFHPEIPPTLALQKIYPALKDNGRLSVDEAEQAHHTLSTKPPHINELRTLLRHFVTHGLSTRVASGTAPTTASTPYTPNIIQTPQVQTDNSTSTSISTSTTPQSTSTTPQSMTTAAGSQTAMQPSTEPATSSSSSSYTSAMPLLSTLARLTLGSVGVDAGAGASVGPGAGAGADTATAAAAPLKQSVVAGDQGSASQAATSSQQDGGDDGDGGERAQAEAALTELIASTRAAFDAGMQHTLVDYEQLTAMNQVAAGACGAAADRAQQLSEGTRAMQAQVSSVSRALAALPQLDVLLDNVSKVVDLVDAQSKALAKGLGVPEGGGVFAWTS